MLPTCHPEISCHRHHAHAIAIVLKPSESDHQLVFNGFLRVPGVVSEDVVVRYAVQNSQEAAVIDPELRSAVGMLVTSFR